ncbi:MAG TPA: hypothetical protein VFO16_03820, partial [Pseudonocardiaceae bacterium]|nr:hypothetical protein [Pseudonocardiaceae bacterium]
CALVLVLGGYLARDVLRSPPTRAATPAATPPAATFSTLAPTPDPSTQAQPTSAQPTSAQSTSAQPTQAQPSPDQNPRDDTTPETLVIPGDYLGLRGSDATVAAVAQGLIPRVVDDDGDQLDSGRLSRCRVVDVNPTGYVPRGSILELTCRRGR